MHEISLVRSILEIAWEQAQKAQAQRIEAIELDVGMLAGVEWHALDFAWQAVIPGTVLEQADRIIKRIPGRARCLECGQEFGVDQLYHTCPACSSPFTQILSGKELRIKALTVS